MPDWSAPVPRRVAVARKRIAGVLSTPCRRGNSVRKSSAGDWFQITSRPSKLFYRHNDSGFEQWRQVWRNRQAVPVEIRARIRAASPENERDSRGRFESTKRGASGEGSPP